MLRLTTIALLALLTLTVCAADEITTITAEALHARLRGTSDLPLVVDVREPAEFDGGHIASALLAPLGDVEARLASVPKDREIVLVCRSGRRSANAYRRLAERGYTRLRNMDGGMLAWEKLGYPVEKK